VKYRKEGNKKNAQYANAEKKLAIGEGRGWRVFFWLLGGHTWL